MTNKNTADTTTPPRTSPLWPAEVTEILTRVQQFLDSEKVEQALELLGRTKTASPWLQNARGACQLRQGNAAGAVEIFSSLVMTGGGTVLRRDVPAVFLTNYAEALLATGNLPGGRWILGELAPDAHPTAGHLREALRRWQASLTFWQRFRYALGSDLDAPPDFDFPLGDLA